MNLKDLKKEIPERYFSILAKQGIEELRPCQSKAIKKGLLKAKNMLICTPTASGKTLAAELAIIKNKGKAVYIVPLKALASEKYKEFKRKYLELMSVALSIGDLDKKETYLGRYDLILATSEKLDSLIRHKAEWIKEIKTVIVDEIHLLNDVGRGPTLEILITTLRMLNPEAQIIGLSATIGNPKELAKWLNAELIVDNWRPVELKKAIFMQGQLNYNT